MGSLLLPAVLLAAIALFAVMTYNKLIKLRTQAEEAWSDIDVQLKRRYNLIPNIVETVKGYATHEEGVLTKVTEARANAINATNIQEQAKAENMLSGALKSLFALAESYPDLKANENFLQLQNELVDTEDKIQASRRFFNGTVRDYNTKLQVFPSSIVASMFKFTAKEFFEIEDEAQKENVKVDFSKPAPAAPETPVAKPAEPNPEMPKTEPAMPATPAPAPTAPAAAPQTEMKATDMPTPPPAMEPKPDVEPMKEEAKPAAAPMSEVKMAETMAPKMEEKPMEEDKTPPLTPPKEEDKTPEAPIATPMPPKVEVKAPEMPATPTPSAPAPETPKPEAQVQEVKPDGEMKE